MGNCDLKDLHKKLLEMVCDLDSFCTEHKIEYVLAYGNVIGAIRHKGFIPWDDDLDVEMTRENYNKFLAEFINNEKYFLQKDTIDYPLQFSKLRLNNSTFIEDIPYRKKYKKIHQGIYIDIFPVDKVSKNPLRCRMQALFSNILISQSLALRGYPKSHITIKKLSYLSIALLLIPFRNAFLEYVMKTNEDNDFDYYCSFFGSTRKVFHKKSSYKPPFQYLPYENITLPVPNDTEEYLKNIYGDYMKLPSDTERKYAVHAKYFSVEKDYKQYLEQ